MKRFLIRTSFFLLPLLVLAIVGEVYVRSIPNSYRLKNTWMMEYSERVETIILGNSHAYYGIRPDIFPNTFNLANVSQVLPYDKTLLLHYAPMCPHLKNVILVVDNSGLFDSPLENSEPHRCTYYTLYMGIGTHSRFGRYGMELFQFDGFCEKLKAYRKGTYVMCDSLGWGNDYTVSRRTFDINDSIAIQKRLAQHVCKNWQWADENIHAVEEIARFCQNHQIHLFLVQTPVCPLYNKGIPEVQRITVKRLTERAATMYGATVLDFSSDPRFTVYDFFDADHLSDIGATKFTRILKERMVMKDLYPI